MKRRRKKKKKECERRADIVFAPDPAEPTKPDDIPIYKRETKKMFAQTWKKKKKCHKKQVNASWWADRKNPTPSAGLRERLHVYRAPSVSWWKVNDASLSACGIWFSPNESIMTAPTTTFLWSVRGGEDHKTSPVITEFRIAEVIIPTRKREERRKRFRSMWGVIQLNLFMWWSTYHANLIRFTC